MMSCADQVHALQFEGKVYFRRSIGPKVGHEQETILVRKSCQSFPIDDDGDLIGQKYSLTRALREKRKLRKPDDVSANQESSDATLENRSFRCEECCKDFNGKDSLDNHMRFKHVVKKHFIREVCNQRFKYNSDLERHSIKDHNKHQPQEGYEECLKCKFCGKLLSSKRNLQRHVETVHEQKKPFKCDRCDRGFGERSNLARHISGFHNHEKPHKCNQCGNSFPDKTKLTSHFRFVHEKLRPFECDVCNKRFGTLSHLKRHVLEVHDHEQKNRHQCKFCGKCLSCKQRLKCHVSVVHKRKKPFKCDRCGRSFGERGDLARHIRVVHEKQKRYECSVCNKRFGLLGSLKRHVLEVHEKKKRL